MNMETHKAIEADEAALRQTLSHFRQSVHAWSDAEYGRARIVRPAKVQTLWRMAVIGVLGCVVAAGALSVILVELRHQPVTVQTAAVRAPSTQPQAALAQAPAKAPAATLHQPPASVSDEELMASIDKDVSRIAPSAMEPLAQLMDDSGTR